MRVEDAGGNEAISTLHQALESGEKSKQPQRAHAGHQRYKEHHHVIGDVSSVAAKPCFT